MMQNKAPFFINILPMNDRHEDTTYLDHARELVRKIKKGYFNYSLVTVGNSRIEPWTLAQALMHENEDFNPLIAVNAFYQHPLSIVKKISALQSIYKNRIALNFIPGSFQNEMKSLGDESTFLERLDVLHEFSAVIKGYIKNKNDLTLDGHHYQLSSARIFPVVTSAVDLFFSGTALSSRPGHEESYFVQNIKPINELYPAKLPHQGLVFGVCARETTQKAFDEFERLYPEDRKGQMLYELAVHNDDTPWNMWIKTKLNETSTRSIDFNLRAMRNFWSPAPFLVGSYDEVAGIVKQYINMGYKFFIIDFAPEDIEHIQVCIDKVRS